MSEQALITVKAETAAEVCANFNLKKEAQALLHPKMTPAEFVQALLAHKEYVAGIDFIAHALPPREAVWWGCLCVQHAMGDKLSPQEKSACAAAVAWVLWPVEENRAAAHAPAEAAGHASPASALASAAFQTGGNLAPPKAPPMAPPRLAPAKAVAGAVKLASTKFDPIKIPETQRQFVELGIGVAAGRFVRPEVANKTTD